MQLSFHEQRTFLLPSVPERLEFTSNDSVALKIVLEDSGHIISETPALLTKGSPASVTVPPQYIGWGRPSGMWFAVHLIADAPRNGADAPYSVTATVTMASTVASTVA
jgi:hypothetical protein